MPWRETLYPRLVKSAADHLRQLSEEEAAQLDEIRFKLGCGMEFVFAGKRKHITMQLYEEDMDELAAALCGYARYACEAQLSEGYLPLPGGHRAGVCGRMVSGCCDEPARMSAVTSVCIRIAKHIEGASAFIRPLLTNSMGKPRRVLIVGPPGSGKTTILRDAAIYLAKDCAMHVAVSDEREELQHPDLMGCPGIDVMQGLKKGQAMPMMIRSMAPDVVVADEMGAMEDAYAAAEAARCGVGLVISVHGNSLTELYERPALSLLMQQGLWDACVQLGGGRTVEGIWMKKEGVEEVVYDPMGNGGHGYACDQLCGIQDRGR